MEVQGSRPHRPIIIDIVVLSSVITTMDEVVSSLLMTVVNYDYFYCFLSDYD